MQAIEETLRKFGVDSVALLQQNIASSGQNASGRTSRDIKWQTPLPNKLVVDGPPYVYVLETGRGPNKNQAPGAISGFVGWAGKTFMKDWTVNKPVDYNPFAISAVIAKHGTKLFRQGGRKDIITPVLAEDRFDKLTKEIADISLKLVVNKIDTGINGAPNP